jgi:tetratricopeptide (TPR) repeat protein
MKTTEIELKKLIKQLELNTLNLDLINQVAIGYMYNPSMTDEDEDLKHFEKAYKIKKTIKSTNNLAWQLYFEWGDKERAYSVQKECIALKPKSYMPYFLFGYMLLDRKEYKEAIENLEIAKKKSNIRVINNNIGVAYYRLEKYAKAIEIFENCSISEGTELKGLYNLAVLYLKVNERKKLLSTLQLLELHITRDIIDDIDGYEIASIYYEISDYENAMKCAVKQGLSGIDLADWKDIAYSIWSVDKEMYFSEIAKSISEKRDFIAEIKSDHEDWKNETDEEKIASILVFEKEVKDLLNLEQSLIQKKPDSNINVLGEYCGCLMFDCKNCGNQPND